MTAEPADSVWWHTAAAVPDQRSLSIASPRPQQHLADVRQARLFIEVLQAELADLTSMLAVTERSSLSVRSTAGRHRSGLSARIDEVTCLLDALTSRFPTA
jgi:hypothetical protein